MSSFVLGWHNLAGATVDGRNPVNSPVEVGSFSHYLHGFFTSQVVSRISSINSMLVSGRVRSEVQGKTILCQSSQLLRQDFRCGTPRWKVVFFGAFFQVEKVDIIYVCSLFHAKKWEC